MALIYEEQTWILNRCFFDVQNEVGLGRHEKSYQRACERWLRENDVPFKVKAPHHLYLGGKIAYTLYPDLVAWDMITVDLKALRRKLRKAEYVQIIDYLKYRGDRLGLLVNMGLERVAVERIPYDPPEYKLIEDWQYWTDEIQGRHRKIGAEVRSGLHTIYDSHGAGYGEEVMEKLILFEMRRRGLSVVETPIANDYYHGEKINESPLQCVVINGCMLLTFSSLFNENSFNISRGLSYMKALNLN